jgi:hypothetical protein
MIAAPNYSRRGRAGVITIASTLAVIGLGACEVSDGARVAPAEASGLFSVRCLLSHRLPDDPIVYPRDPGASHLHDFLGNTSTDADSTPESLRRGQSNCARPLDRSAYWIPTLYERGIRVAPTFATAYYLPAKRDPASIVAHPAGLKVIAGDAHATGEQDDEIVQWRCRAGERFGERERELRRQHEVTRLRRELRRDRRGIARERRAIRRLHAAIDRDGGEAMRRALRQHRRALVHRRREKRRHRAALRPLRPPHGISVPSCAAGMVLTLRVHFPDCWDGTSLDSPDHASHMAYSTYSPTERRAECPPTHPVAVPRIRLAVRYPTGGGPGVRPSSGPGYTAHADFVNAWDQTTLARLVRRCINGNVRCAPG